jgi:hypothetical protein
MTENDTPILKAIKDAYHQDYHTREGDTYDPFVKSMWGAYRSTLQPPATETWKVHKQPESGTPASK